MKKRNEAFFTRYISFILAAVLFMYTVGAYLPTDNEEALYDKILRLHVIANSDADYDQELKLKVRDAVIEVMKKLYEQNGVVDIEEARRVVNENISMIEAAAKIVVFENGYDYEVHVELSREYYPTRNYETLSLPAGTYASLRILIGEAKGQNWWCVLFPTLCLSAATRNENEANKHYIYSENGEKLLAAGFTPSELRIITESDDDEIKVKFRILEILGELLH